MQDAITVRLRAGATARDLISLNARSRTRAIAAHQIQVVCGVRPGTMYLAFVVASGPRVVAAAGRRAVVVVPHSAAGLKIAMPVARRARYVADPPHLAQAAIGALLRAVPMDRSAVPAASLVRRPAAHHR